MRLAQCNRCGKKDVEVHTCTPTKMYREGIIEGIDLARESIFAVRKKWSNKWDMAECGHALDCIDEALTKLIEDYAK